MKTIHLNATISSDLKWDTSLDEETDSVDWILDLGLNSLPRPLDTEAQFQTLRLGLEHFYDTLFLPNQEKTRRVVLYTGSMPTAPHIRYLTTLAKTLSEEMPLFVLLDVENISSRLEQAELLSRSLWEPIQVEVKNALIPKATGDEKVAILLPDHVPEPFRDAYERAFEELERESYRIISEEYLTREWGGLDTLYVCQGCLSKRGERMVQGFQAAGGIIQLI